MEKATFRAVGLPSFGVADTLHSQDLGDRNPVAHFYGTKSVFTLNTRIGFPLQTAYGCFNTSDGSGDTVYSAGKKDSADLVYGQKHCECLFLALFNAVSCLSYYKYERAYQKLVGSADSPVHRRCSDVYLVTGSFQLPAKVYK